MTDLEKIFKENLTTHSSLSIRIHCHVPKLDLKITDSRQMIIYGIGLDRRQGFTLNIYIDKKTNKGKRITAALNKINFLVDFKVFEDKRSMIYLKDFKQEVELIIETVQKLLAIFKTNI